MAYIKNVFVVYLEFKSKCVLYFCILSGNPTLFPVWGGQARGLLTTVAPPSTASPPQQAHTQFTSTGHVLGLQRIQKAWETGPQSQGPRPCEMQMLDTEFIHSLQQFYRVPSMWQVLGNIGAITMNVTGTAFRVST